MILDRENAHRFADEWIAAWNSHDLDRILSHYTEGVVFHSPGIARYTGGKAPFVEGKTALRAYWAVALQQVSDLEFELVEVFVGSDALTIHYANERGQRVAETCVLDDDGAVTLSIATYL